MADLSASLEPSKKKKNGKAGIDRVDSALFSLSVPTTVVLGLFGVSPAEAAAIGTATGAGLVSARKVTTGIVAPFYRRSRPGRRAALLRLNSQVTWHATRIEGHAARGYLVTPSDALMLDEIQALQNGLQAGGIDDPALVESALAQITSRYKQFEKDFKKRPPPAQITGGGAT